MMNIVVVVTTLLNPSTGKETVTNLNAAACANYFVTFVSKTLQFYNYKSF